MRTSTARNRHLVLSGLLGLSAITAALFVPAATFAASSTGTTTTATTTTTCDEGR